MFIEHSRNQLKRFHLCDVHSAKCVVRRALHNHRSDRGSASMRSLLVFNTTCQKTTFDFGDYNYLTIDRPRTDIDVYKNPHIIVMSQSFSDWWRESIC